MKIPKKKGDSWIASKDNLYNSIIKLIYPMQIGCKSIRIKPNEFNLGLIGSIDFKPICIERAQSVLQIGS